MHNSPALRIPVSSNLFLEDILEGGKQRLEAQARNSPVMGRLSIHHGYFSYQSYSFHHR